MPRAGSRLARTSRSSHARIISIDQAKRDLLSDHAIRHDQAFLRARLLPRGRAQAGPL